jgi:hypothetical protein
MPNSNYQTKYEKWKLENCDLFGIWFLELGIFLRELISLSINKRS